ncbi:MAG TPA: 4'-phosphopantetheinyl transferase superfamily protein [Streptosporangiaceae bacterium]|nr:4'-phosphopantetheinyl transferase superfamily protein [Streptosporangiaceae bacterium]
MTGQIVEVWLISTDPPDPVLAELETLLDDDERERADALQLARHRRRFVAAHGAVRVIIGRHLGTPPAQLRWQYGPHGKPELADPPAGLHVSISRSGALAALALCSRRRVGVDIQEVPAELDVTRMSARFYPPDEARFVAAAIGHDGQLSRFTRLWTRKEACLKVAGGRLIPGLKLPVRGPDQADPDQADPDRSGTDWGGTDRGGTDGTDRRGSVGSGTDRSGTDQSGTDQIVVSDPGGPLPGPYLVQDVPVPPGFYAAVAVDGSEPCRVHRRCWPADEPSTLSLRNLPSPASTAHQPPTAHTGDPARRPHAAGPTSQPSP